MTIGVEDVFPITLRCTPDGHYPYGWRETFLAAKPAKMVWFAFDVIIHTPTGVEFIAYSFDELHFHVGDEIGRFHVDVSRDLTENDINRKILILAKNRRLKELEDEELKIINRYADEIRALIYPPHANETALESDPKSN
jgi:hypothetical protein